MFIRLMHLVKYISSHPQTLGTAYFPPDPVMIIVCPTKALEEEMAEKMGRADLSAVAINADTVQAMQKVGRNLFREVLCGVSILLVSPEQLKSKGFERLLNESAFAERVSMMAVDETHLMNTWGQGFRKDFNEIGAVRARFPKRIPIAAVTATLQTGGPTERVCKFLGFRHGRHHIIRRSNFRPDIKLVFRTMKSGTGSRCFLELDWVVQSPERRCTLIFCRTIAFGFRVLVYLWGVLGDDITRAKRLRLFNANNDKSYNDETLYGRPMTQMCKS
ncbi:hypothetical protein F5I97DRAFT_1859693 [Phlebopus sp. FC_14]|nr:hypothetical protein F5I97DRAFT_1859693 [Phlebopus sp. FC_14]